MSLAAMPIDQNLLAIIDDQAAVSGAMDADITSNSYDVFLYSIVSIQLLWAAGATPIGVVYVQGSNDRTNWENIDGLVYNLSGNSGNHLMADSAVEYRYIRVFYDFTSGDGTMSSIILVAKNT